MQMEVISLASLAEMDVGTQWTHAFQTILENIRDPNTPESTVRSVKLTLQVKPNEERNGGSIAIQVSTQMAGMTPVVMKQVHLGVDRETGQLVAAVYDPSQHQMFQNADGKVLPISEAKGSEG